MPDTDQPEFCLDVILPADLDRVGVRSGSGISLAQRMAILKDKPWEAGRTLNVTFLDGKKSVQKRVEAIAHEWSDVANIHFDFGPNESSDIRISFTFAGSWSTLGKDAEEIAFDDPTMNFGWLKSGTPEFKYRRVVLHEFGHALGALHEHQSPDVQIPWDKPKVYEMYAGPPNYWNKEQVDLNLFQAYEQEHTNFTDFDPESIMLYPIPASLTGGQFEVDLNSELSAKDKELMASQYPFDPKEEDVLFPNGDAVVNEIGTHGEENRFTFTIITPGLYEVETRGDSDLVMALSGPDDPDRRVAQDDDSGRDYNARIVETLDQGTYHLQVWHFLPQTPSGSYTVTLRTVD